MVPEGSVSAQAAGLMERLRYFGKRLATLRSRITKTEEEADVLVADFSQLLSELEGRPLPRPPGGKWRATRVRMPDPLKILADAGVAGIEWKHDGVAGALVRFDGGAWVYLKQSQADLLGILAEVSPGDLDGLIGWKSFEDVRKSLGRIQGAPVTSGALRQAVHMLRQALFVQGANPYLVQMARRKGYRFALRWKTPQSISTEG